jgi:hypothetical protein
MQMERSREGTSERADRIADSKEAGMGKVLCILVIGLMSNCGTIKFGKFSESTQGDFNVAIWCGD